MICLLPAAGLSKDAADDVGEGVDALLSLASLAHATSNSCAKEEDEPAAAEQEHEGGGHDEEEAEAATARRAAKAASSKATTPGKAKARLALRSPVGLSDMCWRTAQPAACALHRAGSLTTGHMCWATATTHVLCALANLSLLASAGRKGRRGARRAPVAPKAQHDDDYNPGTEDGDGGDEGEAGKARAGSGGEDERGEDRDEKGSQGGRKRSASTDLPSPTTGLPPKRQASYAAMTGRWVPGHLCQAVPVRRLPA